MADVPGRAWYRPYLLEKALMLLESYLNLVWFVGKSSIDSSSLSSFTTYTTCQVCHHRQFIPSVSITHSIVLGDVWLYNHSQYILSSVQIKNWLHL